MNINELAMKDVVLDETVSAVRIDLRKERLIPVIATDKRNQEHTYLLKVTSKGGLTLS